MAKKALAGPSSGISFFNPYFLIGIICILIYANTLKHGFVLDDTAVVENNKFVKEGIKGIPEILTTFYWKGYWNTNAGLYRPLSLVAFAIEYQISPGNPVIHHFLNILFYTLMCCLLYEFLCAVFKNIDKRFFLFAVLIFAAHPSHTEVVANIKSRDEIFCLLFFLLCCRQLYLPSVADKKNILLASFYFFLALLAKEGAVIFLPLIFLIDYQKEKKLIPLIRQRIPLLTVSLIWFVWRTYVIYSSAFPPVAYTYSDNSLLMSSSIMQQKATALGIFTRYIIKSFYPYELSYDYSFNQIPIINLSSPLAISGLIIFTGLIYTAFKNYKSNPLLTFGIAFLILPLMLTGNLFFNIGATMADRFLFIPSVGSSIIICWIIYKFFKADISGKEPLYVRSLLITILVIFSARAFVRNKDWKSNYTLFSHDVLVSPNSARTHYNNALMMQNLTTNNDFTSSEKEYKVCLSIDPGYYDAIFNLGVVYTKQQRFADAIATYRRALAINKDNPDLLGNIGDTYYKSGQTDSSIYYLERANKLGNTNTGLYNVLGAAWFAKKEYTRACAIFEKGLQKDTVNPDLYLNYANALAASARYNEALKSFLLSYKYNNANINALYFVAVTYAKMGDTLNANKYLNEYNKLKQ
ncbi:MAG: tetratricopeptide repeat protein [Bacteroidia bacterium]